MHFPVSVIRVTNTQISDVRTFLHVTSDVPFVIRMTNSTVFNITRFLYKQHINADVTVLIDSSTVTVEWYAMRFQATDTVEGLKMVLNS